MPDNTTQSDQLTENLDPELISEAQEQMQSEDSDNN